jgi:hypothetical protein
MERLHDLLMNVFDELVRGDAPLEGFELHAGAVGVGAADVDDLVAFEFIVSREDVPGEQTPDERA